MRGTVYVSAAVLVWAAVALAGESRGPTPVPPNTWVKVNIAWQETLRKEIPDGRWATGDGYSDNLCRSKTGTVLIRTGIRSASRGTNPGFYTNTSVEWSLATDTVKVIDIANWAGGSSGGGKLLPAFKERPTPTPRHTYDGMAYVPEEDAMYLVLGANWRVTARNSTEEAKKQHQLDNTLTWRYDFKTGRWSTIDHNVWKLFKCSPYEAHMQYWPEGKRLIFFNDGGNLYAEFDLATKAWQQVALDKPSPMSFYNARSTWDSKRSLWVFRLGPKVCTFDPKTRTFEQLPDCWDIPVPATRPREDERRERDPRMGLKGVTYISKHDVYLVTGPTGNDTMVYHVPEKRWESVEGGDIDLVNGYCQYNPDLDVVAMNFQLQCFKFRYVPAAGGAR
ncbi:MAG: hypothetical protein AMS14_04665 [Planctomycetes bacterium DG_20]|nr:MAG: hypothetical protein AMS14_04665 [Planctomycetes bacterium DG_20]